MPGAPAGSRIGSGAAGTQTSTQTWDAGVAADGLTCCATTPAPTICFLFGKVRPLMLNVTTDRVELKYR